ncbi:hypothetical protein R7F06_22590 [Vibrio sp. Vb2656]|uniref:hypothetical protein n=1 Tax=unclassified Vibrio TaxID=2614977 RepID=UPI0021D127A7|nr:MULTISPECIES: hypothetical protein [unclassified Vibrio]MDW1665778.1 hypothetical protein [Vibrio sp. Vb2656]MDW1703255.1 hypothetical protein [Vibrio sp. Vb2657]
MADWTNIVSAIGAAGSFLGALAIYSNQRKQNQSSEVARLHQMWWSEEMHTHRSTAFKCITEWEANDKKITPIIKSYRDGTNSYSMEKKSIARVAFFFADLNAMIDQGIINEKLAFRIFGDAQFFWFSHFLSSIANEIELKGRTQRDNSNRVVRWVIEVRELDKRFSKIAQKS